jgi:DNA-binding XRE family transcriptional regulator
MYQYKGTSIFENLSTFGLMTRNNDKFLKEFGKNLKKLRLEKGLTTRKFADEADIAHSAVGRLESGLSNPTITTLIRIADALGVDINKLALRK